MGAIKHGTSDFNKVKWALFAGGFTTFAVLYSTQPLAICMLIMMAGACVTLSGNLWIKIAGIAVFTFGFFGGHSIASSWVGRLATHDKAQASALYLFFYYVGSSTGGTAGGTIWARYGWTGVVGMVVFLLALALVLSMRLRSRSA